MILRLFFKASAISTIVGVTLSVNLFLTFQEFIAHEGGDEAPLEGSIPDMTSSTELVAIAF